MYAMLSKILSLILLTLFFINGSVIGQSIPKLESPVYVPNYNTLDQTTMDDIADAINRQNEAALIYSRKIFELIHEYLPHSIDDEMREGLSKQENQLKNLLKKGSPRSHVNEMTIIQNNIRRVISEGIIREREYVANQKENEEFNATLDDLRKPVNRKELNFEDNSAETINTFENIEIKSNRLILQTGRIDGFSAIKYPAGIDSREDIFLESFIQVTDFKAYTWDPSVGIIFGSDLDSNFFIYKINFIDKSLDILGYNYGELSKITESVKVDNINRPKVGNKLSVYKKGNSFHFYLNDQKIYKTDGLHMYGEYIGIYSEAGLSLSILDFELFKNY